MRKTIFVILDGAADSGSRTPFSEAIKPEMDRLFSKSLFGLWRGAVAPKGYNAKSMSDVATLELLGYSYRDNPGRGYLEALGLGINVPEGAVCLRGNFATASKKNKGFSIIDRRAGREEYGMDILAKKLAMEISGIKINCYHSVGHRCVVVMKGKGLGTQVSDTDSDIGYSCMKGRGKPSEKTARVLNEFSSLAYEILSKENVNKKRKVPANFILLRGASKKKKVVGFRNKFGFRACSISGVGIIKGISRYLGIDFIRVRGATGHLDTNLEGKVNAALNAIKKYDFVILHINGCDEAGHDMNFAAKKKFIEKIDRIVFSKMSMQKTARIVVTSDHQTSVRTGNHMFGPVPFMICDPLHVNAVNKDVFSERNCKKGIFTKNIMDVIKK